MTDNVVELPRSEPPVVELLEFLLEEARTGVLRDVAIATRDTDGMMGVAFPLGMDPMMAVGMLTIASQCAVDVALEASE